MAIYEANYDNLVIGHTEQRGIDLTGECSFSKGDVVYFDTESSTIKLISDSTQEPYGVVADDIALEADAQGSVVVYIKGKFNAYQLNFGEGLTFDDMVVKMDKAGLIGKYAQPAK